jgi:hypothetical protein
MVLAGKGGVFEEGADEVGDGPDVPEGHAGDEADAGGVGGDHRSWRGNVPPLNVWIRITGLGLNGSFSMRELVGMWV